MVQIIQGTSPTSDFLSGLAPGISDALGNYMQRKRTSEQLQQENAALQSQGYQGLSGISNPKAREMLLGSQIKGKEQEKKLQELKGNLAVMEKLGFLPPGASQVSDEALAKLLADYQIGQKEEQATEGRTISKEERGEARSIRGEEREETTQLSREQRAQQTKIEEEDRKLVQATKQAQALGLDTAITNPTVQAAAYKAAQKQASNERLAEILKSSTQQIQNSSEILNNIPANNGQIYSPETIAAASIENPAIANTLSNINNQNIAAQTLQFKRDMASQNKLSDDAKIDYNHREKINERFTPQIKLYAENALNSQKLLPITEATIVNNELYNPSSKNWDTVIDSLPTSFLNQFKTAKGQQLEAYTPIGISSFSQKMGGILTNQKINLISKKAVGLGKDKSANRLFLYMDYFDRKLDVLRNQETQNILNNSKDYLAPADFDIQLNDRMKPYQEMIDKDISRLLKGHKPNSPISNLAIQSGMTTFDELPSAKDYTNKTITDSETGKVYKSDGKRWSLVING